MSTVAAPVLDTCPQGLTSSEAAAGLRQYGPNAIPEPRPRRVTDFLRKLSGPVPWMLEATLVLEAILRKAAEAAIIVGLLLLNASLSYVQERRAQGALALLRRRMRVTARVRRDAGWKLVPSEELVPEDVLHVRMGDLVPADMRLLQGELLLDESSLSGESMPAERRAGDMAYSGAIVRRGEATGRVVATGTRSYFGKTAELVRLAKTESHLETLIVRIVKYLIVLDAGLAAVVTADALARGSPMQEVLPFVLMLLVASVPVALPATFSLATALGATELAEQGALVTRLSAVEEAAAMDVLCSDKTGTLTQNRLSLESVVAYPPHSEDELVQLAAHASDEATQDPLDLAILRARSVRRTSSIEIENEERASFVPFDPATKRAEAVVRRGNRVLRVVKGAPSAVAALVRPGRALDVDADVARLAGGGNRVLAVAAGQDPDLEVVGLLGFRDPPREDSREVVESLKRLGIRVLMVTGDSPDTARSVAQQLGIGDRIGSRSEVGANALACDVFAGVLPEDKFHLVRALQSSGRVVGMTGDGVNDAPALKQAEVGIAVAEAADVAKAAASLVLTRPGLGGALNAVRTGRRIYQRMLTYTLNKIVKTFQVGLFLSIGFLLTGTLVTTPRAILLLLFANDFVTMSLATDRVSFSRMPDRWDVRKLAASAMALALAWLVFSLAALLVAERWMRPNVAGVQTLMFLMLVFSGQANVYVVRERRHFWRSRPGPWLVASAAGALLVVVLLATCGILVAPVEPAPVAGLLLAVAGYAFVVDLIKRTLFGRLRLA